MTATRTETEEQKGDDDNENVHGSSKRGNKKRGSINRSVPKQNEGDDFNNTKCKYMYILSFFQNN